ncbi:MAG: hypothetical protein UT05_C0013G0013 [Parcubacteria group bacterium GW2011_GWF2_38_76]|nr:MAG: hypothetical protein UT05_C0013G0013 [Parcubacteria group bacterium GW2011_GWF2_38_76]HBM45396.1 hypothetical protein [Patescibacteria group bacterium]
MDNPTKSDAITSDTSVKEVKKVILQLEAIVEESHDAIIGKTLDGIIVTWNGGATRLFGYSRDEMLGKSIADLFAPGNRDELPGLLDKIKKGETISDYDSIWIKKDGTNADVEFSASPIHGEEKGLIIGSSLVGRDVTDRRRKEAEIQSMANFPMENPYPVFRMSEEGKILFANKASEIFSLSVGSVAPDFWVNLTKDVSRKKETIENVEFGVNERMFSVDIVPIFDKKYVNVYGREITLRKKAEKDLQESMGKYKSLVESSVDCIKFFDKQGDLIFINNGGRKEHNLINEDDTKNFKAIDTIIEEDKSKFIKAFEEAKKGISSEIEIRHTKEGSNREFCLETISPVKDSTQNIIGILGVARDLTEHKKSTEAIREANAKVFELQSTKNEFVSLAAHQLRAPITTIAGFASIFEEQLQGVNITKEQKESIEAIKKSAKDMSYLVEFLLKITRAESGKVRLALAPINLKEIVETVVEVLGSELNPKNQTVEVGQDPDPFPSVFLDKEMVKQVMLNLISNGSRYSPNNSTIKVSMNLEGSVVNISVKDSGIGIPKEAHGKIFGRFYRADNARAAASGTGLGLSLAKALVEIWGGKIWFESEEGKGTTFYFTMPIVGKIETAKEMVLN